MIEQGGADIFGEAKESSLQQLIAKQDDINLAIGGFNIGAYDYVSRGWNAETFTETWTFKSGGTTVATITIVYDNVNMDNIITVTKT